MGNPFGEGLNIWGEEGCDLPEGKGRCNQCCISKAIDDANYPSNIIQLGEIPTFQSDDVKNGFLKAAGIACQFLDTNGCVLHRNGTKPDPCNNYHCSWDSSVQKQALIESALEQGLVNQLEAKKALERLNENVEDDFNPSWF